LIVISCCHDVENFGILAPDQLHV